jgi:stage II sporulation protein D
MRVGDLTTSGIALRQDLGLPSAAFEVAETKTGLSLTVHGHGHGVGLCQYGADGMARAGKRWEEIIAHYLPGVEVRPIFRE